MNNTTTNALLLLGIMTLSIGSQAGVDLASLLKELNDRDAITRQPDPAYKMKLWSSAAHSADWFDNHDYDNFHGVYTNKAGVVEKVLVDAKGPGAIVRAWFAGVGHIGSVLNIYLDGSDEPLVTGPLLDIAGGKALCGAPLSAVISEATPEVRWRAQNLYLPIPYSRSCRVTTAPLKGTKLGKLYYYNIETRQYAEGTRVTSLTREALADAREAIATANAKLAAVTDGIATTETKSFDGKLMPGATTSIRFDGPGAIRRIALRPIQTNEKCKPFAFRKLQIELVFDGVTTVKMPVGAFFNTGYWEPEPHETRFTGTTAKGLLVSRWVMPFAQSCELRLTNKDDRPVVIADSEIGKGEYSIDGRTLRFGATYVARPRVPTRVNQGKKMDLNFVDLKGSGIFAGATVIIENSIREWWGEGDEKIYVDGEKEPSYIGTGSEDYFGYAWCRPARFSHPLLTQPCGDGNKQGGYTINFRGRALDAIPFTTEFRHDMELWHAANTVVDYDSVAYYYQGLGNRQ